MTEAEKQALKDEDLDEFHIWSDGEAVDPIALTSKGMIDIARIIAGGSFGQMSLTDGKPRLSTVKCLSRVHLLILDKESWK